MRIPLHFEPILLTAFTCLFACSSAESGGAQQAAAAASRGSEVEKSNPEQDVEVSDPVDLADSAVAAENADTANGGPKQLFYQQARARGVGVTFFPGNTADDVECEEAKTAARKRVESRLQDFIRSCRARGGDSYTTESGFHPGFGPRLNSDCGFGNSKSNATTTYFVTWTCLVGGNIRLP